MSQSPADLPAPGRDQPSQLYPTLTVNPQNWDQINGWFLWTTRVGWFVTQQQVTIHSLMGTAVVFGTFTTEIIDIF